MQTKKLAHISDLHIGRSPETDRAAARICQTLVAANFDHVVVTGDLTHRGRATELRRFEEIFVPLADRMTVVPGNHDRLGDDAGADLMNGKRVRVVQSDGLYLVQVDSTGPHNRFFLAAHGEICERILDEIDTALLHAPKNLLTAVLLHHHPLPLPEENIHERISMRVGLPYAAELRLGQALIDRTRNRCDLILHGHRHVPRQTTFAGERDLGIYNAGCTSSLERFRVFTYSDGKLTTDPHWIDATVAPLRATPAPFFELATGTEGP